MKNMRIQFLENGRLLCSAGLALGLMGLGGCASAPPGANNMPEQAGGVVITLGKDRPLCAKGSKAVVGSMEDVRTGKCDPIVAGHQSEATWTKPPVHSEYSAPVRASEIERAHVSYSITGLTKTDVAAAAARAARDGIGAFAHPFAEITFANAADKDARANRERSRAISAGALKPEGDKYYSSTDSHNDNSKKDDHSDKRHDYDHDKNHDNDVKKAEIDCSSVRPKGAGGNTSAGNCGYGVLDVL